MSSDLTTLSHNGTNFISISSLKICFPLFVSTHLYRVLTDSHILVNLLFFRNCIYLCLFPIISYFLIFSFNISCFLIFMIFLGMKKNPALQDSPPAAGRFSDITLFRRSAFLPGGLFVL